MPNSTFKTKLNAFLLFSLALPTLILFQNCSQEFQTDEAYQNTTPPSIDSTSNQDEFVASDAPPPQGEGVPQEVPLQTTPNPDPGSGLWVPPNTSDRVIANQSGGPGALVSYVPGCLNGENIISSSSSGCALNAYYTGVDSSTNKTVSFAFGSSKVLGLRFKSKPGAGSSVKNFLISSGDGGNVGQTMKTWLSTSPTATYDSTPNACKSFSTRSPYVITGPGYCPITPNTLYYLFMSIEAAGVNYRYQVKESASDFI